MGDPITTAILGSVITGGASYLGGQKQKKAISRARREQQASANAAQERLAPYQETGQQANTLIQDEMAAGTLGGSFVPGDLASDPGYQFQQEQGEQSLDRRLNASGNLYSGQAIKEGQRFSQGLASQAYQDAHNRWLQTQQNRQNFLTGQQSQGSGVAGSQGNIDLEQGNYAADATMARRRAQDEGVAGGLGAGLNIYDQLGGQKPMGGGFGVPGQPGQISTTPPINPSRFIAY